MLTVSRYGSASCWVVERSVESAAQFQQLLKPLHEVPQFSSVGFNRELAPLHHDALRASSVCTAFRDALVAKVGAVQVDFVL